jgi:UDP-glucuronate 4-epimerase
MSQDAVLITGAASFIGFALARRLLEAGRTVVGVDSINDYYDPALKKARLAVLNQFDKFTFHKVDLVPTAIYTDCQPPDYAFSLFTARGAAQT